MNTSTAVVGGVIAVLLLAGGVFLLAQNSPSTTATSTPITQNTNPSPTPNPSPKTPDVPTVVTGANVVASNSTALTTGTVTPNGAPTTYWYEYGESTALGTRTTTQALGSGFVAINATGYIIGLKVNITYYFRLSAQNRYGTTVGTTYTFVTNNNPPPQGSAPTVSTNSASDQARTGANLNGHVNPNGSSANAWFEYGTDTDLGSVSSFTALGSGNFSLAVSTAISGLKPLTKYYFRMNAQNQYGTVTGTMQNFTTLGPVAPGAPTVNTTAASVVGTSTATLNGRTNPNGAETTYWFEYSNDSLLGNILGTITPSQSVQNGTTMLSVSAPVIGLSRNTKYFYRLVGRNQYGTVSGDTVSFKTKN